MGNEGSKKKSSQEQLFDAAFEMRMYSKQLEKEGQRVMNQEKKERDKIANVLSIVRSYLCRSSKKET